MSKPEYYVYGDQNVQVPAHLNFGIFLFDRFLQNLDKVALIDGETGKALTYRELTQYAANLAQGLIELGVKRRDVVAVATEIDLFFMPTLLAVIFAGATYTPYCQEDGRMVLEHKVNVAKPKYLICSKSFWTSHGDWLTEVKFIKKIIPTKNDFTVPTACACAELSIEEMSLKTVDIHRFEPALVEGQVDSAAMLYSSGTTGMPKGVQLTHLNLILSCNYDQFQNFDIQTALVYAFWCHNYDSFMTFKMFAAGKRVVYVHFKENCEIALKCLERYKVNIVFLIPKILGYLINSNDIQSNELRELKWMYSRSCPLHAKTIQKAKELFPNLENVIQGYGMTEAGEPTSEMWTYYEKQKLGSIGKACPGITLKVVDPQTRKMLGPNEHGEICLRGPVLMKGYIGIDPSTYLDEDGFFKTGDLGYYDEDKYFFIVDRIKEIINFAGTKIAPLELETLLLLHPDVKEAGVVGKPDPEFNEIPAAFVVRQPGSKVTEQKLQQYVEKEVPNKMTLRGGVYFIEKIPRNPRGKLLRSELKKMLT